MEVPEECVICTQSIEASSKVTLGEKGCASINKANYERGDAVHCVPGKLVHQECRLQCCKTDQIAKTLRVKEGEPGTATDTYTGNRTLKSSQKDFNLETDCFFCGEPAIVDSKRKSSELVTVRTIKTRNSVLEVCHERKDDWDAEYYMFMIFMQQKSNCNTLMHFLRLPNSLKKTDYYL